MSPTFGAYQALGRIVIVPRMTDPRGWTLTDTEALIVCTADAPDHEVGLAAIRALTDQRRMDYVLDFRSEQYRKWNAANRKRICSAFGVRAVRDWLPDATYVCAETVGRRLSISPWRRDGERDAWVGQKGDPTQAVPVDDSLAIGAALNSMLAIRLPAAR